VRACVRACMCRFELTDRVYICCRALTNPLCAHNSIRPLALAILTY